MSAESSSFTVTVDTEVAAPVVSGITDDTRTAGDGVTSDSTLVFDGTSEADASVEVFIDGGSIGTATANGSGNWSYDHTGTALGEGTYSVTAVATDVAGNVSAESSAFAVTVDTSVAAPTVSGITNDTGSVNNDGITNDSTLVFDGTSEADASVEVFIDGGSIGTATADGSGNWSYDHTGTALGEGTYSITAVATDVAGNVSAESSALPVTVDTSVAAPVVSGITDDTGTAGDGITSDATLVLDGTSEANGSVEVFVDGGSIGTATADGNGDWSYDHTGTALPEATYSMTAVTTDVAGNVSGTSAGFSVTVDTSAPADPVVTGITDDTGTAGDGVTNDNTLIFGGTSEADTSVEVFIDGVAIGTTTADGSGDWSHDHTGTSLPEAGYSVTAQATDAAGNSSGVSAGFAITVDTTAPSASSLDPSDGATGVSLTQNLVFNASETVYVESGNVDIREFADDSVFESIPIGDARVTGSGTATLTIDPTANLIGGTQYYVAIDAGAFGDLAGNGFAGYTGNSPWSFTTEDFQLTGTTPADEDAGVALDTTLSFSFNEPAFSGAGNIQVRLSSDGSLFEAIDVATASITGEGTGTLAFTLGDTLAPNTSYYIEVDAGALVNGNNVAFGGISGSTSLNFSTVNVSTPTVSNVTSSVVDGTYRGGDTIPLQVTFSEIVNVTGTPHLQINLEGTDKYIDYSSGSGTDTLQFDYHVETGDSTPDLAYTSTSALELNGGTVRSDNQANADLTLPAPGAAGSLSANKNIEIAAADLAMNNFSSSDGFRVQGFEAGDYFGRSLGSGGDINGDGFEDFVIGVSLSDINAGDAGAAYVIFGKAGATRADLAVDALASDDGFLIHGATGADYLGMTVDLSGDLNGDGYDDAVVIASHDDSAVADGGMIYVIWGQSGSTRANVDVSALSSSDGFRIRPHESGDFLGNATYIDPQNAQYLDVGGDFNGDGIHDLIIGHSSSDNDGGDSGLAYVIFGQTGATRSDIELATIGSEGFRITTGGASAELMGHSVQFMGDFNGDGFNDLAIGAPRSDEVAGDAGQAYVLFGQGSGTYSDVNLAAMTDTEGFAVKTSVGSSWLGGSVSASDINGDGLSDLLIGNVASDESAGDSGSVIAIYGHTSANYPDLSVGSIPTGSGFTIVGEDASDFAGHAVVGAGDVNGDGIDDILMSSWYDDEGGGDAGAAWLIYGRSGTSRSDIQLSTLTSADGFKAMGANGVDYFGRTNAAGDLNGDGFQDMIVSSPLGDLNGADTGEANVIWGQDFLSVVDTSLTGTSGADLLVGTSSGETINGGGGADRISAGAGDDIVQVPDLDFLRIDGGRGRDALELTGSSLSMDLRTFAYDVLHGLEIIDLGGLGNNLTVAKQALLSLSDQVRTLYVQGNENDWVVTDSGESWVGNGTVSLDGITYKRYDLDAVSLFVEETLSQPEAPDAPTVDSFSEDTGTVGDGITSDTGLAFTGTTGAYYDVELFQDGVSIGTTTADGAGNWTFDHSGTTLADGSYDFTARATNLGGYTSGVSAALSVTVDATAPAQPVVSGLTDDTGTAGDGITSDTTLVFDGTSEADATVEVFIDGTAIGTATADINGDWSYDHTGTALPGGSYSVTAVATDAAGNVSLESSAFSLTVDTSVATPAVSGITDETGTAGDGITSDTTLIFSGTSEASASVEVRIDGTAIGTTTADGSGNWSYDHTGTALAEGTYGVTAVATDVAGNVSAESSTFSVTVDTTAPAQPVVDTITDDTGTAGDGITSDTTLVFNGSSEANASVEVLIDGGAIGTATADGSGNWSYDHTGTTLAEGTYTVTAQATDLAGNVSALSASFELVVDTSVAAPVVSGITDDTGTAGDGITSDTTLLFNGTSEANASVEVLIDGGAIGTATGNGSGNWSYDHTGTTLAEGTYTVTARATDVAGNVSSLSASFELMVDTTAPTKPVVASITDDTGTAGDGITSDTTLIFGGTSEAGARVEVSVDGGAIGTTIADGNGDWSYDHTGTALADGTYSVTAVATDVAGNDSALSDAFSVTVDTSEASPVVSGITDDTGTAGDGITSDTTLLFDGSSEADATVEVFFDSASVGTTTADGSGNWSYDHTGTVLAEGTYSVTAVATDVAGNVSPESSAFSVTVDFSVAAPMVSGITDDTGTAGDGITSDTTLLFDGSSEANASVEVFAGGTSLGSTTADGSGNWVLDNTASTLAEGSHTITAVATDVAGNISGSSSDFTLVIDTTAPTVDTLSPADGATGVLLETSLEMTFTEVVQTGSGDIVVFRSADDTELERIDVGGGKVSGGGTTTLAINPASDLEAGTDYYVQVDGTALTDVAGNAYAGISNKTDWNFTSEIPVLLDSSSPADDATGVALDTDLTLTFNQTVNMGSGNLSLIRTSDGQVFETIAVGSGQVSGGGTSTITVTFGDILAPDTGYHVNIDSTAFENADGNTYDGISDSTTLNFTSTSVSIPTVTDVNSSTADGTYISGQVIAIDVTFSEIVNVTGIPRIQVNLDGQDKFINYSSGSGSSTLTFNYTVTPGDVSADLGYVDGSSLILNGGTIRSNSLGNADLTLPDPGTAGSLSANKALVVDAYVLDITGMSAANGFTIRGQYGGKGFGHALDGAGDVNGDGYEDFLFSITEYNANAGSVWLIFGKEGATRTDINLATLTSSDGILFTGDPDTFTDSHLGSAAALNGDLNGDGFDDLIMAAPGELSNDGRVYVIWGKSEIAGLDFSAGWNAADGFRVNGSAANEHLTSQRTADSDNGNTSNPIPTKLLDASGDFNGDGFDDLLIGHHIQDDHGSDDAGTVWMILGQSGASRSDIDLGSLGTQGFRITNSSGGGDFYLGSHARFVGDYNGDGYNDIFIGEIGNGSGRAYVVFGKPGSSFSTIDLASMSDTEGFALTTGYFSGDRLASGMDSKDINGDGLTDLVIGLQYSDPNGRSNSGKVTVIYGNASGGSYADIDVNAVSGTDGFAIEGETAGDEFGHAACLGDVDGDGIDDMVLTARADAEGGTLAGAAWVIYGKTGTSRGAIDLATLSSVDGFKIVGDAAGDEFGKYCALADINGNGYQDLLFVSPFGDDNATDSGETNVIWGHDFQAKTYGALTGNSNINHIVGTSAADTIDALGGADTVSAGRSDDISFMEDVSFSRVNGGRGLDTLALASNGLTLDLTALGYHRIQDIELIDLSDLSNSLVVTPLDVLGLSKDSSELYVMGGTSDTVSDAAGAGTWTASGSTTIGGVTYTIYLNGGATLYVEETIAQSGL
ncbi:MAG: Ig-like domain-containing protein [Oleiphilaceae bacterium]|nr:Ig-like domain-containing protein [Oleiphilaceae bacterium]